MHHDLTSTRNYTYNRAVFLCGVKETVAAAGLPFSFQEDCESFRGQQMQPPYRDYQETAFGNQFFEKKFVLLFSCVAIINYMYTISFASFRTRSS